ncbi:hypothetical protein TorRG33x02_218430, partial [Trema orientale]
QAEGEELRELLELLHPPPHLPRQVLPLGPEVVLDAEREQRRAPHHHRRRLLRRDPHALDEPQLRDQRPLHARDQQDGVAVGQGLRVAEPEAAEVEEGGPELVPGAAGEEPGALVDDPPEVAVGDAEVGGEEVEDRGEVGGDVGGEDPGAHAEDLGEVAVAEAPGAEEGDDGVDGGEGGGVEVRVEGEGPARVDPHDLEAEDLLLDLEGEVGGLGLGVERVLVEDALGLFRGWS